MPEVGLEPTWSCPREILSLVRIPISPLRRVVRGMIGFAAGGRQPRGKDGGKSLNAWGAAGGVKNVVQIPKKL